MASVKPRTTDPARPSGRPGQLTVYDRKLKPRPAPSWLSGKPARDMWRTLWSYPVAVLWRDDDVPTVERLILLRLRIAQEGAMAPGWLFGVVQGMEDRLMLNPRARRTAGVVIVPPPEENGTKPARLDARRRERLLRPLA